MGRFSLATFALAAVIAPILIPSVAHAQSLQTFVSGTASTSNIACTRSAPCRDFGLAYFATLPGGEIVCLDSGNFGHFDISHSITVNCTGTNGGPINTTVGITTAATDVVVLKGLDIDGVGNTGTGSPQSGLINFNGAGLLHVENTKINNIPGDKYNGILFAPTGPAKLIVADSSITNIGTAGTTAGIYIKPGSSFTANVSIERSRIDGNNFGLIADGTGGGIIRGLVKDSFVANNRNNGITVSTSTSNTVLTIDNTGITGNAFGLVAGGSNAGLLIRRSIINGNATGLFSISGGALLSYRDNSLNANFTADGAFTGFVNTQ